jgi:hypothetical protein
MIAAETASMATEKKIFLSSAFTYVCYELLIHLGSEPPGRPKIAKTVIPSGG